ncbi:MAG: hypothetical protein HC942_30985 [Microcoleus sp. SU_5_6]|nr:hypothetical protein [Microcoleus sp. SU_5_6]
MPQSIQQLHARIQAMPSDWVKAIVLSWLTDSNIKYQPSTVNYQLSTINSKLPNNSRKSQLFLQFKTQNSKLKTPEQLSTVNQLSFFPQHQFPSYTAS